MPDDARLALCRSQGEWLAAAIAEGTGQRDIDEAHHELFKLHQPWFGNPASGCRVCHNGDDVRGVQLWPCLTLDIVATGYRTRPGWGELWRLIRQSKGVAP